MQPNEKLRALCVSIHDVSPSNWHLCQRLVRGIEEVARIPITLLVVPHFHRLPFSDTGAYRGWLNHRLTVGDELALHGYVHLDEGPPPASWRERFKRNVFTLREGEFSAIDLQHAKQRLEMGLEWFGQRGWSAEGFIAPAWMMSDGTWQALNDFPFKYTTTMQRFYLLPQQRGILSPSLVYTARNAGGRWLSSHCNTLLSAALADSALVRLSLHPNDAKYPQLITHYQHMLRKFLVNRQPMTKAAFAHAICERDASVEVADCLV